ncbi:MAG: DUF222 domain-containing protein [Acidimicrobiia bacterium]
MQRNIAWIAAGKRLQKQSWGGPKRPRVTGIERQGMEHMRRTVAIEVEIAGLVGSLRDQKARLLELVGEYDALGGWMSSGAMSCAHWLANLCDIELSTAREQVRVARALRRLPAAAAAVASGELSYAKARELTRVATPETEEELLRLVADAPAGAFRTRLASASDASLAPRQPVGLECCARDASKPAAAQHPALQRASPS